MTNYWNQRTPLAYRQMQKRHKLLWEYIERFIVDSDIKSVLEVGCGSESPVKDWVKDYIGIDLNENAEAIHKDFTKINPFEVLESDLLLACGVIEHCDGYAEFLSQVKRFNFKHSLITFFCGLDRMDDIHTIHPDGYLINKYSWIRVLPVLDRLKLKYEIINLTPHDDVLIITQENELICEDCGKVGGDVRRGICPYDDCVKNIATPVILCVACDVSRGRDI